MGESLEKMLKGVRKWGGEEGRGNKDVNRGEY